MIIYISPSINIVVKNLWQKKSGTTWYYRRRVPKDIAKLLSLPNGGYKTLCLHTSNQVQAAKLAVKLATEDDAEWARLRSGHPPSVHEGAVDLLKRYGFDKGAFSNDFDMFAFHDRMEEVLGAEGQERSYSGEDPVELLDDPVAAAAVRMARGEFTVSQALDFYLELLGKGRAEDFFKQSRIAVAQLIESRGDRRIESLRRSDANAFVQSLLARGVRTGTVRRRVNVLRAVFSVAIREKELPIPNPFDKIVIPAERSDTAKREPFDAVQLASFRLHVMSAPNTDDLSQMLAMLLDTGARLAEIVGLRLEDVVLDAVIPHIKLLNHPHRRLKTDSSVRNLPLVGAALAAALRAVQRAKNRRSKFLFSRYTDEEGCNAHAASATLNKRIRSSGIDLTCHSLRHTMRDRLRAIECPREIIDQIGGWTSGGVGETYGDGYKLDVLYKWLDRTLVVEIGATDQGAHEEETVN